MKKKTGQMETANNYFWRLETIDWCTRAKDSQIEIWDSKKTLKQARSEQRAWKQCCIKVVGRFMSKLGLNNYQVAATEENKHGISAQEQTTD